MTDAMLTPNDVVRTLVKLSKELDQTVKALKDADYDAAVKRHEADVGESRLYLAADGAVEKRKHEARVANAHREEAAIIAEAVVRHLRREIDSIKTRIDVGRSYGAAVRAELSTLGYEGTP
jgi:hypothetical protein